MGDARLQSARPLAIRVVMSIGVGLVLVGVSPGAPPRDDRAPGATPPRPFAERYRPQFHFSPAANFMNDPNGLVFYEGEYHLFYQHNPEGNQWGHMSWGHAVSPDLVHWAHRPIALREEDGVMIFSGSAVADLHNTTGFGTEDRPPLVAIYTGHGPGKQTQNLAYSLDRGQSWTKFAGNPVLDIGSAEFRDPKVFWHGPSDRWIMVTVLAQEKKVRLDSSADLKKWTQLSTFGPAGATGGVWECPDLFPLPVEDPRTTKWVLKVDVNGGAVAGGSGGQYFVGQFDGTTFTADSGAQPLWVDHGKDFYAAQSWSNIPKSDGRTIWLAWMCNWQYANDLPTDPWRGATTIPRELSLKRTPAGLRLSQAPVSEMRRLRGRHDRIDGRAVPPGDSSATEPGPSGMTLEILAEFEPGTASAFGLKVRKGRDEETVVGYDVADKTLFVDRSRSGNVQFSPHFAGRHAAPLGADGGRVRLHLFVDASSIEVFGNDGDAVITDLIFPAPDSRGLGLYTKGGSAKLVAMDVWELESIWPRPDQSRP
jgi:fructan beta-fructosidase